MGLHITFPLTTAITYSNGMRGGMLSVPAERGRFMVNHGAMIEQQTLPTDSLGNFALTLTNVVVDSRYEVEPLAGGASLVNDVATTSSFVLNIPVYPGGTDANTLRIKIRKASGAPYYQSYETQVVAVVGSQSLFVNQVRDDQ